MKLRYFNYLVFALAMVAVDRPCQAFEKNPKYFQLSMLGQLPDEPAELAKGIVQGLKQFRYDFLCKKKHSLIGQLAWKHGLKYVVSTTSSEIKENARNVLRTLSLSQLKQKVEQLMASKS